MVRRAKGRGEEALASLNLTDPDADHEAEIAEMEEIQRAESGGALAEMLHKPYLRATVFVVGSGFFIQITGINATVTTVPRSSRPWVSRATVRRS